MLVEVAVGVDPVARSRLAIAVVVAEVLPPEAFVIERVLITVGVGRDDEPQLGRLEQVDDRRVLELPLVEDPAQQASVHLDRDPLPRMLVGHE